MKNMREAIRPWISGNHSPAPTGRMLLQHIRIKTVRSRDRRRICRRKGFIKQGHTRSRVNTMTHPRIGIVPTARKQKGRNTEPVSQGFGIASLSIGIVSLLLFCTCINIPLAVLAVVFGILQLTKPGCKKGMAIGGIITSVLSIFLFMVFFIGFMGSINYQEDFQRQLQRSLERQFEDDYEDGYNDGYMDDYEDDYNDGYLDDYGYPSFDWDEDDGFKDGVMDDTF